MRLFVLVALAGCSKSAPPGDVVDEGTIVTTLDGVVTAKETFEIRQTTDRLAITASSKTTPDAKVQNEQEGRLETDLAWKPLALTYAYKADTEGFRYTIGGSPLALDRMRDDGQRPEHIEAKGPIDVFVEGPGLIAMQALCAVDQPATLNTLSDSGSAYKGKVIVTRVTKAATLTRRVVKFLETFELEVFCDGTKLIGSGLRSNNLWNVRAGSEAVFEAAKNQE